MIKQNQQQKFSVTLVFFFFFFFCLFFFINVVFAMSKIQIKHAYSNILKTSPPKIENFRIKNYDIFHISEAVLTSTNNLCFSAEIRKIIYTHVNPSFTI